MNDFKRFFDMHAGPVHAHTIAILEPGIDAQRDEIAIDAKIMAACAYCDREGNVRESCEGCGASRRTGKHMMHGTISTTLHLPKPSQGEPYSA